MWSFTKLFGGIPASRRRSWRTVFGDLESFERRRLLSVAMPAAEIHRLPRNAVDAQVAHASSSPNRAVVASHAFVNTGIGENMAGTAVIVASDDQGGDSCQDDGDIPPVIGKVSW